MVRKFGSIEAFERVKASHGLIPRGAEVGLDSSVNYTQDQLSKRVQSCTLNSHRLVLYVAAHFGLDRSEQLYSILNRKHFTEAGVLNDPDLLRAAVQELKLSEAQEKQCLAFLEDPNEPGKEEVLDLLQRVEAVGIHGIPVLIVDGSLLVQGAARAAEVLGAFEALLDRDTGPSGRRVFTPRGIFADTKPPPS
eukprot:INCI13434.3.p1 GENE.INCI13434.3~~INCI13434.3.p1  ORF type:complete len:193 (+),score=27.87 INCI13434.3:519-1097(+)